MAVFVFGRKVSKMTIKEDETMVGISEMKKLLVITAVKNQMNFQHPDVLAISQQLDKLINQVMKKRKNWR